MMFADLLVKIIDSGDTITPDGMNLMFEEEYKKHF